MRGRRAPARISGGRGRVLGVEVGDQGVPQLETGLILVYDGGAFWLLIRRLSTGTIIWWPSNKTSGPSCHIEARELQTLIMGGNPSTAEFSEDWKKILK